MARRQSSEGPTPLRDLFKKYRDHLVAPQASVEQAAADILSDLLGHPVTSNDLTYTPSSRTLSLRLRGPLRTEALLHKAELMTHLQGRLGVRNAPKTIM
jgi:hypothetical protein